MNVLKLFDEPPLQIACLLCFVIGLGFWHGVLWPQSPIAFGIAAVVFGYAGCAFCLGWPLPVIPIFWLFVPFFWLMKAGAALGRKTEDSQTPKGRKRSKE